MLLHQGLGEWFSNHHLRLFEFSLRKKKQEYTSIEAYSVIIRSFAGVFSLIFSFELE